MQLSIPSFILGSPTIYKIIATTDDGPKEIDKRYNDFVKLAQDFYTEMDEPVPIPPPGKRWFRNGDADACEERRLDLELMMRALVRNPEYLKSLSVQGFLGISSRGPSQNADWLQLSRRVDEAIAKAKTAPNSNQRRKLTLEAKGYLAQLQRQLGTDSGTNSGTNSGSVGAGEKARRIAMVEGYQTTINRLDAQTSRRVEEAVEASTRNDLFTVSGRVLGETDETRKFNNTQLYDHQRDIMLEQDKQLEQLRAAISRQKGLGLAIDDELTKQNAMLEQLDSHVHAVNSKVNQAKKKTSKLN